VTRIIISGISDPSASPSSGIFFHELAADVNCGHNVRSTVFIEARSMYRPGGPLGLRPVGEVEFVHGLAAAAAAARDPVWREQPVGATWGADSSTRTLSPHRVGRSRYDNAHERRILAALDAPPPAGYGRWDGGCWPGISATSPSIRSGGYCASTGFRWRGGAVGASAPIPALRRRQRTSSGSICSRRKAPHPGARAGRAKCAVTLPAGRS
jgi:hypothetical protein